MDNSFDFVDAAVDEAVDKRSSVPLTTDAYVKLHAAGIADPTVRQIAVRAAQRPTNPTAKSDMPAIT
ncbi:hypothetical protein [Catenulispora yoronensis]|uniref:hypothetical protein n=1 Tax=Catenulispora yoronensis TaxID=450799 RepID=UPI0031DCC87C